MKQLYFLLVLIFSLVSLQAQRTGEIAYFSSLPQASKYNPANYGNNNFNLSIPVLGQMGFSFNTSGFSYNDLVSRMNNDSLYLDFRYLSNKLKKNNFFGVGLNFNILSLGLTLEEVHHLSFNMSVNTEARLNFTKSLYDLLVKGTLNLDKQVSIFDDKFVDATSYVKTSFGYARDIDEKLILGANLNLYLGLVNIDSRKADINVVSTGEQFSAISNVDINTANIFANYKMKTGITDGVEFDDVSVGSNIFKNRGYGLDFGAVYKLNDEMTLSASVIDLGYITWRSNIENIHSLHPNTTVHFTGADTIAKDWNTYLEDLGDSLVHAFDLEATNNGNYTTVLPTKIYLSYSYNFLPNMYANALYKGRLISGKLENSLTLSYSYNLSNLFTFSLGNTFASKFFNPSLLISFKDIVYVGATVASSLVPKSASGFSMYLGVNIVLKNKKDSSL